VIIKCEVFINQDTKQFENFWLHRHCEFFQYHILEIDLLVGLFLCRCLKGHGIEADFLGFLQELVPHESLTLPLGPF
jgi:hypothetical protein